ncbi:putative lipid II flippase FtsW [Litorivicinus lipolyticus]|uniref:Probable peptidoglycan glycosyltransferase FtsW n=1 Tax=Litorivicinus lipolyticus TaxID=418701 RepID=A0A5Q2QIP6_9GAMM|nr:putative lipid II flippase FtsW [Litorivicinus lipolyticus]QGG80945.1 putative lipid II flippase FtsW [Litorivicinus lipolyticus]
MSTALQALPQGKTLTLPDPILFWTAIALSLLGVVMVGSASIEYAAAKQNDPSHYLVRHSIFWVLAMGAGIAAARLNPNVLQRHSAWFYLLGLVLLAAVFLPGIGHTVNGSTRWLNLVIIKLQASEVAKLCLAIYLSSFLVRFGQAATQTFWGFIRPILVTLVYGALLLAEPDLGAFVIIFAMVLCVMFLAGSRLVEWFVMLGAAGLMVAYAATTEAYRMKRVMVLLDPWEYRYSEAYQLTQALLAFGKGGWFGEGLGNSVQKLFYLPEAHTDFLFAILAEELGLVGALTVVALFVVLIWRSFRIGRMAELKGQFFNAYLAYAFALMMAGQATVNMGVNTGLLPTTGLTLPLMSYGGSSLIVSAIMLGLLQRIAWEAKQ